MTKFQHLHSDPSRWKLHFDWYGWTITSEGCPLAYSLTDKQALWIVGTIRRAVACHLGYTAEHPWGLALV